MSKIKDVEFNHKQFAKDMMVKRLMEREIDLRTMAGETFVSFGTISRLEHGATPDLTTYAKICAWLKKPMETYLKTKK